MEMVTEGRRGRRRREEGVGKREEGREMKLEVKPNAKVSKRGVKISIAKQEGKSKKEGKRK